VASSAATALRCSSARTARILPAPGTASLRSTLTLAAYVSGSTSMTMKTRIARMLAMMAMPPAEITQRAACSAMRRRVAPCAAGTRRVFPVVACSLATSAIYVTPTPAGKYTTGWEADPAAVEHRRACP
jgi:hypothetical protein